MPTINIMPSSILQTLKIQGKEKSIADELLWDFVEEKSSSLDVKEWTENGKEHWKLNERKTQLAKKYCR